MRNRNHPGCPCCGGGGGEDHCNCYEDDSAIPDTLVVTFELGSVSVVYNASGLAEDTAPAAAVCGWFGSASFTIPGVKCSATDLTIDIGFWVYWMIPAFPSTPYWEIRPKAKFVPAACFDGCSTIALNTSPTAPWATIGIFGGFSGVERLPDQTCSPVYGGIHVSEDIEGFPTTVCDTWYLAVFPHGTDIVVTS